MWESFSAREGLQSSEFCSPVGLATSAAELVPALDVSEDEFWNCVLDGRLPGRGAPAVPKEALPADLVYPLLHRVGLAEETVAELTKEDAVARLHQYWTEGT
ncbi:hypothetical protein [Streptomyces sp. NPDC058625]|uniref:hypothetical protein n=1 Tax=Streptomyces sp. NPDC058625 TaxID=3346564 RepID=UPI003655D7CF